MLNTINGCIDCLTQIMRRNIGCIPGSDTRYAVDQQIGIAGRKHGRLHRGIIEVWCP